MSFCKLGSLFKKQEKKSITDVDSIYWHFESNCDSKVCHIVLIYVYMTMKSKLRTICSTYYNLNLMPFKWLMMFLRLFRDTIIPEWIGRDPSCSRKWLNRYWKWELVHTSWISVNFSSILIASHRGCGVRMEYILRIVLCIV